MELSEKSWLARFYKTSYGTNVLPQSLCPYFWGLVFALLVSPLTTPLILGNRLFNKRWNDYSDIYIKTIVGATIWGLVIALIMSPVKVGIGLGVTVLGIGGIIGLFLLVGYLVDSKTPEPILIVKESFKGFIGRYCPRITWKK